MSLMNSVLGALGGALGGAPGGQQGPAGSPLLQIALSMLAGGGSGAGGAGGGLNSLIEAFQRNGMGEQVQSWIGTGRNLPISPDALQQVLGSDTLGRFAEQFGIPREQTASGLADLLPQLIDQLSPQGQLPEDGLGDLAAFMEKLGAGRA